MFAPEKSINETMALLKADCENTVIWFTSKAMKANHGKLQFMIVPAHDVTDKNIITC